MGSPKKQTIGYWYRWLMHMGWCRPVDALLELRAGGDDYTLWSGRMTASGRLSLDKPNLWGGEKGEGGVQGEMDVCFGEQTQTPNDYLRSQLGDKQSAHRGKFTTVLRGARYGAFTANPKTISAKVEGILNDWQDASVWYPEKAAITVIDPTVAAADIEWRYLIVDKSDAVDRSAADYDDSSWALGTAPFASSPASGGYDPSAHGFSNTPATVVPIGMRLWTRATIVMTHDQADDVTAEAWVDNNAKLYVNGVLVATFGGIYGGYYTATIPAGSFVEGENVIAVDSWDNESPDTTYTDWFWSDWRINELADGLRAMNPAHMLYQSVTEPDMQGEPVGLISDASFRAAADQLYAEGFGLCTTYDSSSETPEDFQQRTCNVIGASLSQSRVDGLYYLDLVRAVTDIDSLPVITEDDVIEYEQDASVITESTNSVSVAWTDPQTKQDRTTAPVRAAGTIRAAGIEIVETKSYPEIPVESLALRVAARDLRSDVMPLNKYTLTTLHRFRDLRPGLHCRLQLPSEGITDMVCVVGSVDHGTLTDSKMQLVLVQDVFALPDTVYAGTQPTPWTPPDNKPAPSPHQLALEAPYIELVGVLSDTDLAALPADAGYLLTAATRPTSGVNYTVATAAAGEDYVLYGIADWCPTAGINESAAPLDAAFTLADGQDLDRVTAGSWAQWGDEIVRVDAIDADAGTLTLGRGCGDTVPQIVHGAGDRIYFIGDWTGTDQRQYVGGDTVNAKLLTNAADQLPLSAAPVVTATMADRQIKPYPPGNVQIAGAAYPSAVTGPFAVTWASRNRVTQADQLIDTTAASVSPEVNTRYALRLLDASGALLVEKLDIGPTTATVALAYEGSVTLELYSVTDNGSSLQKHAIGFAHTPASGASGNVITADSYVPVDDSTIIDGGQI